MKNLHYMIFYLTGTLKHTQSIPRQDFFPAKSEIFIFSYSKGHLKGSALKMFSVLSGD